MFFSKFLRLVPLLYAQLINVSAWFDNLSLVSAWGFFVSIHSITTSPPLVTLSLTLVGTKSATSSVACPFGRIAVGFVKSSFLVRILNPYLWISCVSNEKHVLVQS